MSKPALPFLHYPLSAKAMLQQSCPGLFAVLAWEGPVPQGCSASCLGGEGHAGRHHRAAWGVARGLVCTQRSVSGNACLLSCKLSLTVLFSLC